MLDLCRLLNEKGCAGPKNKTADRQIESFLATDGVSTTTIVSVLFTTLPLTLHRLEISEAVIEHWSFNEVRALCHCVNTMTTICRILYDLVYGREPTCATDVSVRAFRVFLFSDTPVVVPLLMALVTIRVPHGDGALLARTAALCISTLLLILSRPFLAEEARVSGRAAELMNGYCTYAVACLRNGDREMAVHTESVVCALQCMLCWARWAESAECDGRIWPGVHDLPVMAEMVFLTLVDPSRTVGTRTLSRGTYVLLAWLQQHRKKKMHDDGVTRLVGAVGKTEMMRLLTIAQHSIGMDFCVHLCTIILELLKSQHPRPGDEQIGIAINRLCVMTLLQASSESDKDTKVQLWSRRSAPIVASIRVLHSEPHAQARGRWVLPKGVEGLVRVGNLLPTWDVGQAARRGMAPLLSIATLQLRHVPQDVAHTSGAACVLATFRKCLNRNMYFDHGSSDDDDSDDSDDSDDNDEYDEHEDVNVEGLLGLLDLCLNTGGGGGHEMNHRAMARWTLLQMLPVIAAAVHDVPSLLDKLDIPGMHDIADLIRLYTEGIVNDVEAAAAAVVVDPRKERTRRVQHAWDGCLMETHAMCRDTVVVVVGCWNRLCRNVLGMSEASLHVRKCSTCKMAAYCSTECQRIAWRSGHKGCLAKGSV